MGESLSAVAQRHFIVSILPVIYGYGLPENGAVDSLLYAKHVKRIAPLYLRFTLQSSFGASASWLKGRGAIPLPLQ